MPYREFRAEMNLGFPDPTEITQRRNSAGSNDNCKINFDWKKSCKKI